jgi:hypothetical protein
LTAIILVTGTRGALRAEDGPAKEAPKAAAKPQDQSPGKSSAATVLVNSNKVSRLRR